jgi:2-polyprenyl-3-methyl-5-hydroxy-6-metoxy-1,4-benzoquinol methylase
MEYKAQKTELGYYSVDPLPSAKELEQHYREKYYQDKHGCYQNSYTDDEIRHLEIKAEVAEHIFKKCNNNSVGRLLDVGAGEGFFAKPFFEKGWEVCTCDFTAHGMQSHNPSLLKTMILGDIFETLASQVSDARVYDLINLKNVLEHILDPVALLRDLQSLLAESALLRIEVPNDYSPFQNMLLNRNKTTNTWFAPPDHLHYFNFESIRSLLKSLGFAVRFLMADFPIELYLLNDNSNYVKDRSRGKQAHLARIAADIYIYEQGIDAYIDFFSACAAANLGRNIIAYVSKNV